MVNPEKFLDYVREEFDKLLSGPGISWNKVGMLSAFDRASIKAISRLAKEMGVVLD